MEEKTKKLVVIMIPTYNESENIEALIREILSLNSDFCFNILIVDDNSPDRTGEIVKTLAKGEKRIQVLIRTKRRGRGAAGIDGFKAALSFNPDYVIEMDGDFSHQPKFIPLLLSQAERYDLVIGSRFVKGGKDVNRNIVRKCITFMVRSFIRLQFKLSVKDISSGFRCFKKVVLEKIDLDDLISIGPSIVLEILYKTYLLNFKIGEVPIDFIDRTKGKSKLNLLTLFETLIMACKFKKQYRAELSKS